MHVLPFSYTCRKAQFHFLPQSAMCSGTQRSAGGLLAGAIEVTVSVELLMLLRKQSHQSFPNRDDRAEQSCELLMGHAQAVFMGLASSHQAAAKLERVSGSSHLNILWSLPGVEYEDKTLLFFFLHLQAAARLSSFKCAHEALRNSGSLSSQLCIQVQIWGEIGAAPTKKGRIFECSCLESLTNSCF